MKRARQLLIGLALVMVVWFAGVFALVWRGPEAPARAPSADYALVLGAAVADSRPTPVFAARIDHGIALWREGQVRKIVFTGGIGAGDVLAEAEVARRHAMASGVPARAILVESRSRTTQENIANAAPLVGQGSVLLVSDRLHLTRALAMARDAGMNAAAAPAQGSAYRSLRTRLPFALREVYFLHHYWLLGE